MAATPGTGTPAPSGAFAEIWARSGLPAEITKKPEILDILRDCCGWRKLPMLPYPVLPAPDDAGLEAITADPSAYAKALESECIETKGDPDSYRKIRPIPVVPWGSVLLEQYLAAPMPVIVRGARLVKPGPEAEFEASGSGEADARWSPSHIAQIFGPSRELDVYESRSRYFRYWKSKQHTAPFPFQEPTTLLRMRFSQFLAHAKGSGEAKLKKRSEQTSDTTGNKLYYLQESLSGHAELASEFAGWDWPWLLNLVKKFEWGIPDRNILLVGMQGATTPAHYDEQENMFCQMRGRKEIFMWPPSDHRKLYAFPVNHACDRQAMVNPDCPDLKRFPNYRYARPHYATLQAGDLLYLPVGWWHHLRNLDPLSVSITFWCKQQKVSLESLQLPLKQRQLLTVRRNLEEMTMRMFGQDVLFKLAKAVRNSPEKEAKAQGKVGQAREFMAKCLSNFMPKEEAERYVLHMLQGRYLGDAALWVQSENTTDDLM